jgi:hypothetical protein
MATRVGISRWVGPRPEGRVLAQAKGVLSLHRMWPPYHNRDSFATDVYNKTGYKDVI